MEEDAEFLFRFDPDFPIDDVEEIGRRLTESKALIPGWIVPEVGAFDIRAVVVAEHYDGWSTVLLPDRNIISRMARVAREGSVRMRDHPMDIAILLMAFAQAVNFNIEPGLAFHELAQRESNQSALDELRWFRTADTGGYAREWIDLALDRKTTIAIVEASAEKDVKLTAPIRRWRCNYVVAMKIAALELSAGEPADKLIALLEWMNEDFLLAAPALIFAARYWAPNLPRAGLIKYVRSPDRSRVLKGARNAAWDITYLSEFSRKVSKGVEKKEQIVLATGDRLLAEIAPILLRGRESEERHPSLEETFSQWWPAKFASRFCDAFFQAAEQAAGRSRWNDETQDPVDRFTHQFEKDLLASKP
ncbi:hypothetical protein [Novosphingobium sp. SG707]|uniref:hypothetical protein n=1 Tax=Novosphingobium sp. SG707 TaxID=2586996 RepID=UPI0014476879|nr:hypothetical protein [Novosphingobium sp. SG707]NKJ02682.1 hypothetical protein [Novosphingobium sp. SG707]